MTDRIGVPPRAPESGGKTHAGLVPGPPAVPFAAGLFQAVARSLLALLPALVGGPAAARAQTVDQTAPVICWQVVDSSPLERAGGGFARGPDFGERERRALEGLRWLESSSGVRLGRPLIWDIEDPEALSLLRPNRGRSAVDSPPSWLDVLSEDPQLFLVSRGGQPFAPQAGISLEAGRALWITARDNGLGVKSLAVGTRRLIEPVGGRCDGWQGAGHVLEATAADVAGNRDCVRWPLLAQGERIDDPASGGETKGERRRCSAALVPDLRGRPLEEVKDILWTIGLRLGPIRYRPSWRLPGMVLDQDPPFEPGGRLPEETTVTPVVGRRPPAPKLVGKTLDEAERELAGTPLRLDLGAAREPVETGRPTGVVYRISDQDPRAGDPVPGDDLTVEVEVEVPDLGGRTPEEAVRRLEEAGLARGRGFDPEEGLRVARQEPETGRLVPLGTAVDIELTAEGATAGTEDRLVEVPGLLTVALREARRRLEATELRAGKGFAPDRARPGALVVGQTPAAGDLAPVGSAVDVVAGTRVPDLLSEEVTVVEAARRVSTAGLTPRGGFDSPVPDGPEPLVAGQDPEPETPVPFDDPVDVVTGTRVPDLVGQEEVEARRLLAAARLALGGVLRLPTTIESRLGTVATQDPVAGVVVPFDSPVGVRIAGLLELPPHRWPWRWIVAIAVLTAALLLARARARRRAGRSALRVEGEKDPGVQSVEMRRRPRKGGAGHPEIRLRATRDPGRAEIESAGPLTERETEDGS